MGKGATGCAGARAGAGEPGGWHWEERAHEPVQPVRDEEGVEWGKGLGVGHDEGHDGYCEHAVGAHLRARDGDAWDVGAVRREDDVVRRDEEDGVRDGVLRGRARLHGEYMRWWWDAADGGDVKR